MCMHVCIRMCIFLVSGRILHVFGYVVLRQFWHFIWKSPEELEVLLLCFVHELLVAALVVDISEN